MTNERAERRLTAILAADVAGYSRLMGADEEGTLIQLKACRRELVDPEIAEHRGRIVKTTGDGMLVEFASVVDAVACAAAIQRGMVSRHADVSDDMRITFRIGINVGDIIIDDGDIFGDGVNVAARLEGLCEPGGLCISRAARDQIRDKLTFPFADLGEQSVKNIARPIRAFGLTAKAIAALPEQKRSRSVISAEPTPKPLALPDKPSLAVLPFQNISGDPEQDYFCDGMVEEIITALSRVRSFFVIARNSSFTYKGKSVDVKQVGRELGVRYVLEGGVRKAGNRVRITGQLIEAATEHHIWADRFEGSLEDVFELQDRVTESVVGAIEPELTLAEIERAKLKPTENLAAYDLYLRSLPHFYCMTKAGNDECLKLLCQAISIEPTYSLAKAMAARCYTIRCAQYWASESDRAEGTRLAHDAIKGHRDDPMTLRCVGNALAYMSREFDLARFALDRAMALNPNSAVILSADGWLRTWLGDTTAAVESFTRAIRLSPLDPDMGFFLSGLSSAHIAAGRFEDGLAAGLKAVREMPTFTSGYQTVIRCLVELGRVEEARAYAAKLLQISPGFTIQAYLQALATLSEEYRQGAANALRAAGVPE
ncbi:adenylate cyclase [Rhizobiales bacterium GAS113]|nr:adenylate cyclase [Rhizobiales bacterium GAS113]